MVQALACLILPCPSQLTILHHNSANLRLEFCQMLNNRLNLRFGLRCACRPLHELHHQLPLQNLRFLLPQPIVSILKHPRQPSKNRLLKLNPNRNRSIILHPTVRLQLPLALLLALPPALLMMTQSLLMWNDSGPRNAREKLNARDHSSRLIQLPMQHRSHKSNHLLLSHQPRLQRRIESRNHYTELLSIQKRPNSYGSR